MDRGKNLPGTRGPKAKITQQMPDSFIALGAKQGTSRDDPKRTIPLPKPSVSTHSGASTSKVVPVDKLKREGSSSSLSAVPPSKKLKVGIPTRPGVPGVPSPSVLSLDRLGATSSGIEPWELMAIDSDVNDTFEKVLQYIKSENIEKTIGYVLGIVKSLKSSKSKPCKVTWSVMFSIASIRPEIFINEHVLSAMLSVLRRDIGAGIKGMMKSNAHVHHMFLNLICHAFGDKDHWPEMFVKMYVEDAIGDRVLIDSPFAKPFVDNVTTAFNTKSPPNSLLRAETWTSAARDTSSPLTINLDDDDTHSEQKAIVEGWQTRVTPRYTLTQEKVEQIVLEAIKDLLARRTQPETISKNFVKFLSTACGLNEIRIIAVSRIETWLHNHKLMKSAQELLAYLCYNCSATSQRDLEVIAQLSKLRLKNKPTVNFFNNCLREMVLAFPENLFPLLKYTIYSELSNARNSNNLIVVGALFQVAPEPAADAFADICLELLLNKDDYLRSLRALLKEINRVLRHDFNLLSIVHALLKERKEFTNSVKDHEFRERIFLSLADLACMCMLLCVSPQVRDAATQSKRDVTVFKAFQMQVSNIQRECVTWLQDSALRIYKPSIPEFHHVLLKVLFLEQAEQYYKIDSWPGENERNLFLRLASEVPLLQATLLRVLFIGISKEHPIAPTEVIEITDQLIKRSANLPQDCAPPLMIDKIEIVDFFFNLCSYNYPENITLPHGYVPPKLAISNLYWKVWLMLLILAAHNPLTFGNEAWEKYPILRMFMEMCITNHFSFPPPTMTSLDEDYQVKEQQILTLEKQTILEFESHLAAASTKAEINEQTSLLLPQLMELRPQGEARRPPQHVLDMLQALNNSHRLGHLLCRSRNPDFLLDIMSRQGGTAHMPWLAELVHSSEGVLAHLPVQCLCEYLLSTAPAEKLTKHGQLLAHLRTVVNGNDPQMAIEVLEYLFRRLTSDHGASRAQATKGLCLILAGSDDSEISNDDHTQWLTQYVVNFPHFVVIKPMLIQFLRQAVQIETNPARISSYINFLATQDCSESFSDLNDLITDLSSVIIERHSVASYVLPGDNNKTLKNLLQIFSTYTQKAKEHSDESYSILQAYNSEYVIVSWATGETCAMQTLAINATVVLLTYGAVENCEAYTNLLNNWFPSHMERPRAYSPDTSETTSYLPDWMKLRMIRSNVDRLVDAAIENLKALKLVLFIQSFGIPTTSISKLLHMLDKATILDRNLVVDSVLDKGYMIQLVEVQNKRGAEGGEIFARAIIESQVSQGPDGDVNVNLNVDVKKELSKSSRKDDSSKIELDIMERLKYLFNPHYDGDKNKIILSLIKNITFKPNTSELVFNYIKSLTANFVSPTIVEYNSFSTLFRLIFTTPRNDKIYFANQLLNLIQNKQNSSALVLNEYLQSCGKDNLQIKESEDPIDIIKTEELITNKKSEVVLNCSDNLGEKLGKLLLEDESKAANTGLLVDWLSSVELDIDISDKYNQQIDLLFSRRNLQFRPLLMSLVLQRASWKNLYSIMKYLLQTDINNICPVSALDYLMALTNSPKLWQGRDKAIPKHYHFEDILQLDTKQVQTIMQYVVEEAKLNQDNWKKKMEYRLQLLLKCIGESAGHVVKTLLNQSDTCEFSRELLLTIYMSLPFVGQDNTDMSDISGDVYQKTCPSAIDRISHCLLSALAATPRSKDWPRKSLDLEMCARKLASTHPALVLRQLPMLSGCLKGRAQYDWGVLKSRGHLMLFGQVLGLLELLQPHIFKQTGTLCDLLDSYFLLLHVHGNAKDLTVLIKRIVTFVQNWMVKDVKAASRYLQEHGAVLNDIQYVQPSVRPLLSSVSLPTSDQGTTAELLMGTVTPPVPEPYPQHWNQLKSALQSSDRYSALQEIDHLTNKRPQLLESVCQFLYGAIGSPNSSIRNLALLLIVRWLKYNPKAAEEALPFVLTCLDSENGDVVESVLDRLSDLVVVMQEFSKVVLTRVFQLGMKPTLNTTSNITKSIDLLNLQYGC